MENQTRFNLDDAIAHWTARLPQRDELPADRIRELQSHLREAVADLSARGLSPEESFVIAARRMGEPAQVAREIAKEESSTVWRTRFFWMIAGVCAMNLTTSFTQSLVSIGSTLTIPERGGIPFGVSLALAAAMPLCALVLARIILTGALGRCAARFQGSSRLRIGAIVFALFIGMAIVNQIGFYFATSRWAGSNFRVHYPTMLIQLTMSSVGAVVFATLIARFAPSEYARAKSS